MSPQTTTPPVLSPLGLAVLQSVHQHRLLSTAQVRELHRPTKTMRWTQHVLARLHAAGLLAAVRAQAGMRLWYLTERGATAATAAATRAELRRKLLNTTRAIGLHQHTLAVNDVGIAFVNAARRRDGDECGPLSWHHEIAHPLGPPPGQRSSEQLIADALLSYQLADPDQQPSFHYRLIELDRATVPVDELADKLARYARLYHHTGPGDDPSTPPAPLWTHRYAVFPGVLLVLAGRRRELLQRRRDVVLGLCRADAQLTETPAVQITACLLEDLTAHGPFAEIFTTPAAPDRPTDWLADDDR